MGCLACGMARARAWIAQVMRCCMVMRRVPAIEVGCWGWGVVMMLGWRRRPRLVVTRRCVICVGLLCSMLRSKSTSISVYGAGRCLVILGHGWRLRRLPRRLRVGAALRFRLCQCLIFYRRLLSMHAVMMRVLF